MNQETGSLNSNTNVLLTTVKLKSSYAATYVLHCFPSPQFCINHDFPEVSKRRRVLPIISRTVYRQGPERVIADNCRCVVCDRRQADHQMNCVS